MSFPDGKALVSELMIDGYTSLLIFTCHCTIKIKYESSTTQTLSHTSKKCPSQKSTQSVFTTKIPPQKCTTSNLCPSINSVFQPETFSAQNFHIPQHNGVAWPSWSVTISVSSIGNTCTPPSESFRTNLCRWCVWLN